MTVRQMSGNLGLSVSQHPRLDVDVVSVADAVESAGGVFTFIVDGPESVPRARRRVGRTVRVVGGGGVDALLSYGRDCARVARCCSGRVM